MVLFYFYYIDQLFFLIFSFFPALPLSEYHNGA